MMLNDTVVRMKVVDGLKLTSIYGILTNMTSNEVTVLVTDCGEYYTYNFAKKEDTIENGYVMELAFVTDEKERQVFLEDAKRNHAIALKNNNLNKIVKQARKMLDELGPGYTTGDLLESMQASL